MLRISYTYSYRRSSVMTNNETKNNEQTKTCKLVGTNEVKENKPLYIRTGPTFLWHKHQLLMPVSRKNEARTLKKTLYTSHSVSALAHLGPAWRSPLPPEFAAETLRSLPPPWPTFRQ